MLMLMRMLWGSPGYVHVWVIQGARAKTKTKLTQQEEVAEGELAEWLATLQQAVRLHPHEQSNQRWLSPVSNQRYRLRRRLFEEPRFVATGTGHASSHRI